MSTKKDAWLQFEELLGEFTYSCWIRSDINVIGHGTDRSVELILTKEIPGRQPPNNVDRHTTGKRSVHTMRELAEALTAACDFVEDVNPEWASQSVEAPIERSYPGFRWVRYGRPRQGEWYDNGTTLEEADSSWATASAADSDHLVHVYELA